MNLGRQDSSHQGRTKRTPTVTPPRETQLDKFAGLQTRSQANARYENLKIENKQTMPTTEFFGLWPLLLSAKTSSSREKDGFGFLSFGVKPLCQKHKPDKEGKCAI